VSLIFWAILRWRGYINENALFILYQRITTLAEELAAAQWDLMLWQSNVGIRRFLAMEIQETAGSIGLQIKIPQWLTDTELHIQQVDGILQLSLEWRERVNVPGYCDFLYSPDCMESTIPLTAGLNLQAALWDPTTHLYTITLSKGMRSSYEYAPVTSGVYCLPSSAQSRSHSLAH
jgi:hypothetical protein